MSQRSSQNAKNRTCRNNNNENTTRHIPQGSGKIAFRGKFIVLKTYI